MEHLQFKSKRSRTPQGVRGLKRFIVPGLSPVDESHSARSAWIETTWNIYNLNPKEVALRKECVD